MRATLFLLCAVFAAVPAGAVTLVPGTYNMEWRIPEAESDVSFAGRRGMALEEIEPELAAEVKGLVSDKPLVGETEGYVIVVDESNGPGSGYDTVYLFHGPQADETLDLARAVRLRLARTGAEYVLADGQNAEIELALGPEGAKLAKRAVIELRLLPGRRGPAPEVPDHAVLTVRGGWYGKIRTDEGEIEAQTLDMNSNGIYNESMSPRPGATHPQPGDLVLLGSAPRKIEDYRNLIYLARAASYDGRLYEFDVAPTGETLTIRPYFGDVGRLVVKAVDGSGQPTAFRFGMFSGDAGVFGTDSSGGISVPPGEYRCTAAFIGPASGTDTEKRSPSIYVRPGGSAVVPAGGSGLLRIGGPIKAAIAPGAQALTARRGQELVIKATFTVGDGRLSGFASDRTLAINIRNSRGKLLHSGRVGFGSGGECAYSFRIPSDWKPGTYSVGVGLDASPYQKKMVYAKRKLDLAR